MGFEIARLDSDIELQRVDEVGLHGLQNCTSMWVQFWGIIYNITLYYYNEYLIKLHRCAILQFCNFSPIDFPKFSRQFFDYFPKLVDILPNFVDTFLEK